jgi:hypothetical protein
LEAAAIDGPAAEHPNLQEKRVVAPESSERRIIGVVEFQKPVCLSFTTDAFSLN